MISLHQRALHLKTTRLHYVVWVAVIFAFLCLPLMVRGATLSLSPATGVYQAGDTFSVSVVVNTEGSSINASDATLSFNPKELSVVSVSRAGSIFNLWITEPTFSNTAGTISFGGGLPAGYTGSRGTIMNVTFRSLGSGTSRVTMTGGSVLANDGRGTNVLTSMNSGSYTIQSKSTAPMPEVIVEYVPPSNTPPAPVITSSTHGDTSVWYSLTTAELAWTVPAGVTAVRTLIDDKSTSIPSKVYETPINSIKLPDLPEGVSYFHLQFKNADGWGKVSHYRLAIDSKKPNSIKISLPADANMANPEQKLLVLVQDDTSEVKTFKVKVNATELFTVSDETGSGTIALPTLEPGYHVVTVEAFDQAGNSIVDTFSFTIESFDKLRFTEYPSRLNEEVIPVIMGMTRPDSIVHVVMQKIGSQPSTYTVNSDQEGLFTFIPEGTLSTGVYELSAYAIDSFGARSEMSDVVRIVVEQPGYLRVGGYIISVLSVIVPLLVLVISLILGTWYLIKRIFRLRKRVRTESSEALEILHQEFSLLRSTLVSASSQLAMSRKSQKLTKAEETLVADMEQALATSEKRVQKEIGDVSDLVDKNRNEK